MKNNIKKNNTIKIFFILTYLAFYLIYNNLCLANQYLPQHESIPGGVAVIPLDIKTIEPPIVFFNDQQTLVVRYNNNKDKSLSWITIVGLPIITKPGLHKISVHAEQMHNKNFKINLEKSFVVYDKHYPSEKLTIDPKLVSPPTDTDKIRAAKELKSMQKAYSYWSQQIPNLKMQQPVKEARKSSVFGLKRILNGKNRGYHSGLDLAAPIGTPVYAPSSGQIILTGNFFYTGNTIFIDHGKGLITSYFHLNTIDVAAGDVVAANQVIGSVGATGRVTGPHLHWSVSLNNARINPELFLK